MSDPPRIGPKEQWYRQLRKTVETVPMVVTHDKLILAALDALWERQEAIGGAARRAAARVGGAAAAGLLEFAAELEKDGAANTP